MKSLPASGLSQLELQNTLDKLRERDLVQQSSEWAGRCFMFNMQAGDAVQSWPR